MKQWTGRALVAFLLCALAVPGRAANLGLGIIGTDLSHAVEFTRILNDGSASDHVTGARIMAAYRGGNPAFDLSHYRIRTYSAQLDETWHIPFVPTIHDLYPFVDGLLLLSADPGLRQREFTEAAVCNKPVFVDKPFIPDLPTASKIARFASEYGVAWFSASSMRFAVAQELRKPGIRSVTVWGPGVPRMDYPLDLAWYGIHSIKMLFAELGPGVQAVARLHTQQSDVITSVWSGGRTGVIDIVRPDMSLGLAALDDNDYSDVQSPIPIDYMPLLRTIVYFMKAGQAPVSAAETLKFLPSCRQHSRACSSKVFRFPSHLRI